MARQVIKSVGGLVLISIAMFVVSIILFILGFKKMHRYQLVADTPTSKVRSIAMGLVEVKGEAEAKQYLKSPFSKDSCIYYKYKIYEYSEHLSHDDNGKTYSWDPVGSGEKRVPFFLKDATGSVLIDPTKAEFKVPVKKAYYQKSGLFGATTIINLLKNYDKTMKGEIDIKKMGLEPLDLKDINKGKISISIGGIRIGGPRVGDRKYLEYYIGSDEQTYVLGTAAEDANAPNHIIIKKGENEPTFIISNRSEKGVIKTYKKEMIIFFVISIITFLSGIGLLYFALS